MKFIKNGVIYEPHNEFVIAQMMKGGYTPYEETKEEKAVEETKEAVKENTKEEKVAKKTTKKK